MVLLFQNVSNRSKVFQNVSKNEFYSLCKSDIVSGWEVFV